MRGLDEVQQLASSGRTSIPANKDIPKSLYRVAGYRVAGERAVRVDILERLADLIRPALAWRNNSPGIKPPGALDGTGFTVTVGMTSLVGSSGEDFASILRSLGYRMERRPKPPDPVAQGETQAADATPQASEAAADNLDISVVEIANDNIASDNVPGVSSEPSLEPVEAAEMSAPEPQPITEQSTATEAEPVAAETSAGASSDGEVAGEVTVQADVVEAASSEAADVASAEPVLIEVWRPGRFEGRDKRPHRKPHRREHRGGQRSSADQPPATSDGAPVGEQAAAGVAPTQERRQDHRPHGARPPRKDRGGRARRHEGGPDGQQRFGKADRPRQEGHPRPERREREPDPNSPFAKLAALKAQLEADSKERR
jgi:ATP-dependent RNA helicase SUPV3L1/SUV3